MQPEYEKDKSIPYEGMISELSRVNVLRLESEFN